MSTPTPTEVFGALPDPSKQVNRCNGLQGALELKILIGPAEAAGLDPLAVGEIPFAVVSNDEPYIIEGSGAMSYDGIYEAEWGTYSVTADFDVSVGGECSGAKDAELLNFTVEMSGNQLVEVRSDKFQGDYPWSGTHQLDLAFPLMNGAEASGEGWQFILLVNQ